MPPTRTLLFLIAITIDASAADLPAPFTPADYPCWHGPLSCGASIDTGLQLIGPKEKARHVWTNDESLPTLGWTNRKQKGITGGFCSPVVCAGRVFHYHLVPGGEQESQSYIEQFGDEYPGKFKILADEVYLCVDAKTGKTIWKQVFAAEGINLNHSAQGPLALPFATKERVYALSNAGYLRCFEAATGKQLWKAELGPATAKIQAELQRCLKDDVLYSRGKQASAFGHCPTLSDGVVVCNDNWDPNTDTCGVVGIDAESGKLRWGPLKEAGDFCASPLRTVIDDKPYVVTLSRKRLLLVEPASGRIRWEINDHEKVRQSGTMAIGGGHIVFHARSGNSRSDAPHGYLRCYRFDADKAEKVWEIPAGRERGKQAYGWGSCLIYDGLAWGCFNSPEIKGGAFGALELSTGKPVLSLSPNLNHLIASEGRIFEGASLVAVRGASGWQACERKSSGVPCLQYTKPSIAGGFMYTWGGGHLHCYDLKK